MIQKLKYRYVALTAFTTLLILCWRFPTENLKVAKKIRVPSGNLQIQANLTICILVIACDRTELLNSTLNQLFSLRSRINHELPIAVSQDCGLSRTGRLLEQLLDEQLIQNHFKHPKEDFSRLKDNERKRYLGYYRISSHYKWAIRKTFETYPNVDKLIIVEDDLNFSPDFLDYFLTLAPLMDQLESIYCISAWNDNGKAYLIDPKASSLLHRTDFFPGLGWMLKKSIWLEIEPRWPATFWDDWFRAAQQRKDRWCVRPEISRTSTSGRKGVSKGQFYQQHLQFINHYRQYYPFMKRQKTILNELGSDNYDRLFLNLVYNQTVNVHWSFVKQLFNKTGTKSEQTPVKSYRMTYYTKKDFLHMSKIFGLMNDFKNGIPRTAYKGVVTFFNNGVRFYLAPPISRKHYLVTWT